MFPAVLSHANNGRVHRILIVALATLLMFAVLAVIPGAPARAGGERTAHFYAADPDSYDPETPGDDGDSTELVSSLEGGDFTCTSTVVYLVLVETKDIGAASETWSFSYDFPQTGVNGNDAGHRNVTRVQMNPNEPSHGQVVTNVVSNTSVDPLRLAFDVTGIDSNETTWVRIEVALGCGSTIGTGNITPKQVDVDYPGGSVTTAAQTIPFKHFGTVEPATLTLVKTVVNDDGGTLDQGDFPAFIDGQTVQWDDANTVSAGAHTASETTQSGYAASSWGGDCAANGSITLNPGDNKTCTITNNDQAAGIDIEKATNGEDADTATGPLVAAGDPIAWMYEVTNTGLTGLTNVTVTDDQGVAVSCGSSVLAVGESMICTASGTAIAGQYSNIGSVTATAASGAPVSDEDPSHYYGVTGGIDIEKATNGEDADTATGPLVAVGDDVTWLYLVQATGNSPLDNVIVTDSQGVVPVFSPNSDTNDNGLLDPGEIWVYEATGVAVAGQYANIGTATGTDPLQAPFEDVDPSHYYGVTGGIDIEKATNGEDADAATGPLVAVGGDVTWTYEVSNTGNVPISDIVVTDDQAGVTPAYVSGDANTDNLLDPGEIWVYEATGVAVAGQYANVGVATGLDPLEATVEDLDPSHYYGVNSAIGIEKTGALGLGDDGVANPGDVITYEFEVTNDGNADLIEIDVADLDLGGINVTCPATELAVGESMTCTADYPISQEDIDSGTVHNCALASGLDPLEAGVSDEDCIDTTIPQTPAIDIEKATNGVDADTPEDAPVINVGDPVTWTYVITNTGNVPLEGVAVDDSILGAISCPEDTLAVGATMTCEAFGVAGLVAYVNVGTATGTFDSTIVSDEDPSHYFGVAVAGTSQIGDTVWQDTNKNGVQDAGETGINGAKVTLKDADGAVIATATTAKGPWDGWYKFVGLDAGRYTVTLDTSSVSGSLTTASSFTIDLADGVEYLDADFGVADALPKTGADTELLLVSAALLLGLGAVLVLSTRRRRDET